ncbi:MAG: hypothetical protein AAFP18_06070, partial [Bacteroidota bacterium]
MAPSLSEPVNNKIDVTSTAVEKTIEAARDFVDKLIMPATEELGLLVQESVSLWRFKNQIRVLTEARGYCDKNGISPQSSDKLIVRG